MERSSGKPKKKRKTLEDLDWKPTPKASKKLAFCDDCNWIGEEVELVIDPISEEATVSCCPTCESEQISLVDNPDYHKEVHRVSGE